MDLVSTLSCRSAHRKLELLAVVNPYLIPIPEISHRPVSFHSYLSSSAHFLLEDEPEQEAAADRQFEDPLNNSSLQLRFHQLLISIYLPLETWYLKFIIERVSEINHRASTCLTT